MKSVDSSPELQCITHSWGIGATEKGQAQEWGVAVVSAAQTKAECVQTPRPRVPLLCSHAAEMPACVHPEPCANMSVAERLTIAPN